MKSTAHVDQITLGNVLEVDLHGRLARQDFQSIVPETERLIRQYGKIRLLVTLHDFDGWDAGAMWEDLKWEAKHFNHVERLAIVGEERWHRWMARFCQAFTTASVRYFTFEEIKAAFLWIDEQCPQVFPRTDTAGLESESGGSSATLW